MPSAERYSRERRILRDLCAFALLLAVLLPRLEAAGKAPPLPEAERRWAAYEKYFQDFTKRDIEHPPAQGEILFVGSSIFRRWDWVDKQMAPLPVLNRAFGGSRTSDQLARFEQVVPPYAPKVIVYYCGSNDIKVRPPAEIAANFRIFVDRVHAGLPRTRILYASILRAPQKQDRWGDVDAANKLIRDYCATDPRLAFIDINPAVFDKDGQPRLDLYLEDKLHYLPPAYDSFAAIIKPVLEQTWREVTAEAATRGAGTDRAATPGKSFVYKSSGGESQKLEVFFPKNHNPSTARAPALLLFHGGGWRSGDRSKLRAVCVYFASRGMVAATADYRKHTKEAAAKLPPGESFKRICVTDGKSAIRWMKQHASELGVDPERLVVGGGSAGAHIAVLATINPALNDPADLPEYDTSVAAYVLFNPAFASKETDSAVDALAYIKRDFAPAIVLFGTNDRWLSGWSAVHARLKALGNATTELWTAKDGIHGFYLSPPWEEITLAAADDFLVRRNLLTEQPCPRVADGKLKLEKAP